MNGLMQREGRDIQAKRLARLLPDCLLLSDALNHNSMIEGGANQA
jgi:hypothetical protein